MSAAEVGPEVSLGIVNVHLPHLRRDVSKTCACMHTCYSTRYIF